MTNDEVQTRLKVLEDAIAALSDLGKFVATILLDAIKRNEPANPLYQV
jgi:hypothetical protein